MLLKFSSMWNVISRRSSIGITKFLWMNMMNIIDLCNTTFHYTRPVWCVILLPVDRFRYTEWWSIYSTFGRKESSTTIYCEWVGHFSVIIKLQFNVISILNLYRTFYFVVINIISCFKCKLRLPFNNRLTNRLVSLNHLIPSLLEIHFDFTS